jgi:hypothetical protein
LPHPRNSLFKRADPSPHLTMKTRARRFTPNREVLMIHADENYEGLERIQLDDYNDYLLDPLDEDVDVTMDRESSSNIKVDDADNIQKEHRRLINVKRAQQKHHAIKTN